MGIIKNYILDTYIYSTITSFKTCDFKTKASSRESYSYYNIP